jgi:hypothetical protein
MQSALTSIGSDKSTGTDAFDRSVKSDEKVGMTVRS